MQSHNTERLKMDLMEHFKGDREQTEAIYQLVHPFLSGEYSRGYRDGKEDFVLDLQK